MKALKNDILKIIQNHKAQEGWITQRQIAIKLNYSLGCLNINSRNRLNELVNEGKVQKRRTISVFHGQPTWVYRATENDTLGA